MENQLVKVITESKVEKSTALSIQNAFLPFYDNLLTWSEKAKTLVVTDASQVREMKMAREARLALKDIRVNANKTRVALKEDSNRYGKAVQSVYNLIEGLITPAEKHLEEQERFVEIQEEKRKAELKKVRTAELLPYEDFVSVTEFNELGEYSEREYSNLLIRSKELLEQKLEEDRRAEEERQAKEREKVKRQGRLFRLGYEWDGIYFRYKNLKYALIHIVSLTSEEFEKICIEAEERKRELDAEEKRIDAEELEALDKIGERVIPAHTVNIPASTEFKELPAPSVSPAITVLKSSPPCELTSKIKHPFHCFLCGSQLKEIGLGGLECDDCLTVFIPFIDQEGNQCLASQK